ncbi:hypothetical protein FRC19_009906 [Serendipita sp. 401]|nr:hypothetical protein FRC19_009906 [Serendipita sp. 401]KAG9058356.1 hypothetical protein FS842_010082 [Serendipita sp. 407]
MPPIKKRKLEAGDASDDEAHDIHEDISMSDGAGRNDEDEWSSEVGGSQDSEHSGGSLDTGDEITIAKMNKKSKKTAKRKIRATSPSQFGDKLEALLNTNAPVGVPLALKKSINRRRKDEKETLKARKVAGAERKEHEEVGRITDIIGGWGGENERALRKIAQRGVVQLFNVVQKAQSAKAAEEASKLALRGSGKPTLDKPDMDSKNKKKKRQVVAVQKDMVDKDVFMNAIRSGGVVSKV